MKKRYKIPLALISFLFLVCLIFWIILTQTKFLENQVNRSLGALVKTRYPIQVKVDDITGSFWDNVVIKGLTVDFTEAGQEYRIAEIPYMKASYRLSNLWRKKWILDSLIISGPKFTIAKTEEGSLLIPLPKKEKGVISKTGLFDFRIGDLRIEEGSLEYLSSRGATVLDSLNFEVSLSKDGEGTRVQVLQGRLVYPQKEFLLRHFEGTFSVKNDSLSIEGLRVQTDESMVEMSGDVYIKGPGFSFSVKTNPVNLEEIKKLTGVRLEGILDVEGTWAGNLKKFQGRAELDGKFFGKDFDQVRLSYVYQNGKLSFPTLVGRIFESPLNGKGELDFGKKPEGYRFEGEVSDLDLNNIVSDAFHTDLTGNVVMEGRAFSVEDLVMNIGANLGNGRLDQFTFSAVKGSLSVTSSAVSFSPGFQMDYKNTQIVLDGDLEYDGEVDVNARVTFKDLKDFENQIFIKEMAGRGKAELKISGKTSDFDVQGIFTSDSCFVYQLYSSEVKTEFGVANFLGKRKGTFDLSFLNGSAWSIPYDSLTSRIQIDQDWVTIDSTSLENQYMNVAFWGTLDVSKVPQPLTLDKVVVDFRENHLESSSPVELSIDSLDVKINRAVFSCEEGKVEATGTIDYEERMNLSLEISELDITPWTGLIAEEKLEGDLSFQAVVNGDFTEPQFDLEGRIADLRFEGMDLGQLKASLSYKDKKLEFRQFDITGVQGTYALAGTVPVDLSFSSVDKRFPQEPQSLSLKVKRERLDLIRLFIPEIEYLEGPFEGDLEISGEFLHPQFDGKFDLEGGTLKFTELSDPVIGLGVKMRMGDKNLILDQVSGFMEHQEKERENLFKRFWRILFPRKKIRGEISGFGSVNLEDIHQPGYALHFVGKDVPVNYEYADLSAVADFSVALTGKKPPLLSAEVLLTQLYYRESFASSATGTSFTPSSGDENLWDWNLTVSAVNNCWVINDDVNLEFNGDVLVVRENGELSILGNLETIRGKYFLYGTKFKIDKGVFTFDNIERIDPKIDFLVSTDLRGGTSKSSEGLDLFSTGSTNRIELAIGGTVSAPEVEPVSGSPYSNEDIIELLAFQQGSVVGDSLETEGGATLFQERVIKSLGGAYGSRFLENIAGRSLGVETFEIVPAWGDKFSLRDLDAEITVGKYVSDKMYLRYTRRLSQSSGQEAGVEYRLNRHLLLEGRRDKIGLFHLGLSLNWEY